MDLFEQQWYSYRAIVDHNLMEHREVAAATAAVLEGWLKQRPEDAPSPRMVDLGCGDLALLAPLLRRLPLASYTGLDLATPVLPLAAQSLGPVPYPTQWLERDLLAWATEAAPNTAEPPPQRRPHPEPGQQPALWTEREPEGRAPDGASGPSVDILHSAFAIHHLSDQQKASFLAAARQRLSPGGVFVWADVFRPSGESRQAYVERYTNRIETGWLTLSADQRRHVIDHLWSFDNPADRTAIVAMAEAAGWCWRWAWNGAHGAEAVAVLTPV
jgi:hypothetical protein